MNKTLLQILVDELPNRGGWPDGVIVAVQCGCGHVEFYTGSRPRPRMSHTPPKRIVWVQSGKFIKGPKIADIATDHATAIVTKEQYEAALKENQNE